LQFFKKLAKFVWKNRQGVYKIYYGIMVSVTYAIYSVFKIFNHAISGVSD